MHFIVGNCVERPFGIACIVKEMFIESNGEKIMTLIFFFLFPVGNLFKYSYW